MQPHIQSQDTKRKCVSNMSKTRFNQIIEQAHIYIYDEPHHQAFVNDIKEIMHFDPMLTQIPPVIRDSDKRGSSIMSKKRFWEIDEKLKQYIVDKLEQDALREKIMLIMKFDPNAKQYDAEKAHQHREQQRDEAAAKGISVHKMNVIKYINRLNQAAAKCT
jgi:ABC-type uncharacterized transport system fused permease/ATPase subunit